MSKNIIRFLVIKQSMTKFYLSFSRTQNFLWDTAGENKKF